VETAVVRAILDRRGLFIQDHRPDLPARQREVLLLEYFGFEADEMANLFGTSMQTVKNQLHQARAAVVPARLPPTRANASVWTDIHRICCMATAFAMLEVLVSA
jgi:hypothetical protein